MFTLLAATIQTSDFDGLSNWIISIEIFSWVLLTIAGLAGLSFLETIPVMYKQEHAIDYYKEKSELVEKLNESLKQTDKSMSKVYKTSKYAFIIGLVFVVFSRSIQGVCY